MSSATAELRNGIIKYSASELSKCLSKFVQE